MFTMAVRRETIPPVLERRESGRKQAHVRFLATAVEGHGTTREAQSTRNETRSFLPDHASICTIIDRVGVVRCFCYDVERHAVT